MPARRIFGPVYRPSPVLVVMAVAFPHDPDQDEGEAH